MFNIQRIRAAAENEIDEEDEEEEEELFVTPVLHTFFTAAGQT